MRWRSLSIAIRIVELVKVGLMQVSCPKCSQPLQLSRPASGASLVKVQCPGCQHGFQVKLPTSTGAARPAPPANRSPAPSVEPDFGSLPAAASPPATTFRQPAAPKRKHRVAGSRGSRGKKSPSMPIIAAAVAGAVLIFLLLPLAWWAYSERAWLAGVVRGESGVIGDGEQDVAGESLLSNSIVPRAFQSDSPEKILDEFVELQERDYQFQKSIQRVDSQTVEKIKQRRSESQATAAELLDRAIRLPPAPRELQEKFRERQKLILEKSKQLAEEQFKRFSDAEKQLLSGTMVSIGSPSEQRRQAMPYLMLVNFVQSGMYETPPSEGKKEELYVREIDLLRQANQLLFAIDSTRKSAKAASEFDALAEKMIEIAVDRSPLGNGMDIINRSIADLGNQLERMIVMKKELLDQEVELDDVFSESFGNFLFAKSQFGGAGGREPDAIREAFAKRLRQQSGEEEPTATSPPPEAFAKPSTPVSDPNSSRENSASSGGNSGSGKRSQPSPTDMAQADEADPSASNDSQNGNSQPGFGRRGGGMGGSGMRGSAGPGMRSPFQERMRQRMQERTGLGESTGQSGAMDSGRNPYGFGPERFGRSPSQQQDMQRQGGPGNSPASAIFEQRRKALQGKEGATISFVGEVDAPTIGKQWAQKLGVKQYMTQTSNGKTKLLIRWTESIESLVEKLDFADVLKFDVRERTVEVSAP